MVDRNSPIPIYYQLKLHFKQQMKSGLLQPGDRLPTEMKLCRQLGISRAPVRQALTELAREGFIYRRPGQGTFVAPESAARLSQRTTIRILTYYDVLWMASLEQAVHHWNFSHPEQEVDLTVTMCPRSEFHQVLRRAVAKGEAPDMVPLDYVWITNYARAGYIVPLDTLDALWTRILREDLEPVVAHHNTVDGKLYGLPTQADVTGMWYRRDWFAKEGLTPPETWDAWLALLDHFSSPGMRQRWGHRYAGAFPIGTAAGEATLNLLLPFVWGAGGELLDEKGNLALDTLALRRALRFLQQITLERRAALPPQMASYRWWNICRLLGRGITPMTLGGTYEWPRIREESEWTDEADAVAHLGFVPVPRPSLDAPPVSSLGGTSWVILQQSPAREVCLEILKLVVLPENLAAFCGDGLQISAYRSLNRRLATTPEHPWLAKVIPLLSLARSRPLLSDYPQVSRFLQKMLEQVLWVGAPLEETVRQTAQALALLLEY